MGKIYQNSSNLTLHQGWYGICAEDGSECEPFKLIEGTGASAVKLHSNIHSVYEVRSDGLGQLSYNGGVADGMLLDVQQIKQLNCGHSYLIILKEGDGFVDINNFVSANSESADYRMVSSCEVEDDPNPTPTPKQPTPTPKLPTPTPKLPTPTPTETPTPEKTPTPIKMKTWEVVGGSAIRGKQIGDASGYSLSLNDSGSTIAIGEIYSNENGVKSGRVRVFTTINGQWVQKGSDILGDSSYDLMGTSVSLCSSGNTVAVSAIGQDIGDNSGTTIMNNVGEVTVFRWNGNDWVKKGDSIKGIKNNEQIGRSIALKFNGNMLAVGITGYATKTAGAVVIYVWVDDWEGGGKWVVVDAMFNNSDHLENTGFSIAMSENGRYLAIGSPGWSTDDENLGQKQGKVELYQIRNLIHQAKDILNIDDSPYILSAIITGKSNGDRFGRQVSISNDGSVVAVGSGYIDNEYGSNSGEVSCYRVNWDAEDSYVRPNENHTILGNPIGAENNEPGNATGESLALSKDGRFLVVGSPYADPKNQMDGGRVRLFRYSNGDWKKVSVNIIGKQQSLVGSSVAINHHGNVIAVSNNPGKFENNNLINQTVVFALKNKNVTDYTPTPVPQDQQTPTPTPASIQEGICIAPDANVTISGGKYLLGTSEYKAPYKLGLGVYTLRQIPMEHPLLLSNADETKVKLEGTSSSTGSYGTGYYGDVKIFVFQDFGTISYMCANHGFMGGENNLVFDLLCPPGDAVEETPESQTNTICDTLGNDTSYNVKPAGQGDNSTIGGISAVGTEGTLCYKELQQGGVDANIVLISLGGENYEEGGISISLYGTLQDDKFGFIKAEDGTQWSGTIDPDANICVFTKVN